MALSASRREANDRYISKHYTRIALSMPNDEADALRAYCSEHGLAVAGFIRGLIREAISADGDPAGGTRGGPGEAGAGGVTLTNSCEEEKG